MSHLNFFCPQCRAPLRIWDSAAIDSHFDCPDCGRALSIAIGQDGAVSAECAAPGGSERWAHLIDLAGPAAGSPGTALPEDLAIELQNIAMAEAAAKRKKEGASSEAIAQTGSMLSSLRSLSHGQVVVAGSLFGACLLVLGLVLVTFGQRKTSARTNPTPAGSISESVESPASASAKQSRSNNEKNIDPSNAQTPSSEPNARRTVETQLSRLGAMITAHVTDKGRFPVGRLKGDGLLSIDQRFSWLAELEPRLHPETGLQPLTGRSWRDPLNDRFVRRSIPEFQNPLLKQLTGVDGYPTTHFVGVTGVGTDAARLPIDHPRAGIFGDERSARIRDVKDGTSNTILLAGVERDLGSWASGGTATIRAFTRKPYVNGPDGFGTGQPQSMFVLMADGSVREISKDVDAAVVAHAATMADGFGLGPADETRPGDSFPAPEEISLLDPQPMEPHELSPEAKLAAPPREDDPKPEGLNPEPRPDGVPPKEPPEPQIDVAAALAQKILQFDQPAPAALKKLLVQIEEMLGVPIEYTREELGPAAAKLEQPISLKLKKVTVGEILQAMLQQTGLTFRVEENRIHLIPLEASEKTP